MGWPEWASPCRARSPRSSSIPSGASSPSTATRLKTPIVNVVWENHQYGSIVWKQDRKFGEHFGTDFTNPDFVRLAEAFGMPAYRCEAVDDFGRHLRHALTLDVPSLIVMPIDYSVDVRLAELGAETVSA